jgi:hypothetical protein
MQYRSYIFGVCILYIYRPIYVNNSKAIRKQYIVPDCQCDQSCCNKKVVDHGSRILRKHMILPGLLHGDRDVLDKTMILIKDYRFDTLSYSKSQQVQE